MLTGGTLRFSFLLSQLTGELALKPSGVKTTASAIVPTPIPAGMEESCRTCSSFRAFFLPLLEHSSSSRALFLPLLEPFKAVRILSSDIFSVGQCTLKPSAPAHASYCYSRCGGQRLPAQCSAGDRRAASCPTPAGMGLCLLVVDTTMHLSE